MSFPKIRIGNALTKTHMFDLSHTNNTTSDFGFIQPIFSTEMKEGDNITINVNDFIRLAPMPHPSFARGVKYKKYGLFVPYEDLYKPFANLISQKPYAPAEGQRYIPSRCPYVQLNWLCSMILAHYSTAYVYKNLGDTIFEEIQFVENRDDAKRVVENYFDGKYLPTQDDEPTCRLVLQRSSAQSLNPAYADFLVETTFNSETYAIAFKLSKRGRNLRKILIGLGYQMDLNNNNDVNVLPLFAFYKGYFDIFYPQRYTTWTDTNAYTILNTITQTNVVNLQAYANSFTHIKQIKDFIAELSNCFYTYSADYFSAQLGNNTLENTTLELSSQESLTGQVTSNSRTITSNPNQNSRVPQAGAMNTASVGLTANQIWMLEKFTKYVNKNTIVGGKIHEWLTAHGLGKYIDDHRANFLGASESDVKVFDVDCTSPQDLSPLGNYAGKGVGNGNSKFHYSSNCYGQLIIMGCIVPVIGYCQGTNPKLNHTKPLEFYHPEFDALGMIATRKSDIICDHVDIGATPDGNQPFGLIPRYSEYKQQQNIINGDISLNSYMPGLIGFTLDRYMIRTGVSMEKVSGEGELPLFEGRVNPNANFSNSINWRFCNKYPWMGNFNRIFYNSGLVDSFEGSLPDDNTTMGVEDNFIIHHLIDVKLRSNMVPLSDSYMTDSNDEFTIAVDKQ